MAYYQVIGANDTGKLQGGDLMANIAALGNAMGKNINSQVIQQAAANNGLIPEYNTDQATGDIQTSYKSPALVARNYYAPGAPGNPTGKPGSPERTSQAIQDALAQTAADNASKTAASYAPGVDASAGWSLDPANAPSNVAPAGPGLPTDPSQIFQSALLQQANQNPIVAKSLGLSISGTKAPKENLDSAISDAQTGNQTWADVINKYPTKIKEIQQARRSLASVNAPAASAPSPADASTAPTVAAAQSAATPAMPAGAAYYSASTGKYYDANKNEIN
jgi:hypothetical protein